MYAAKPFIIAFILGVAILSATGLRSVTGSEVAFVLPFIIVTCGGAVTFIRMRDASASTKTAITVLVASCLLLSVVHVASL